MSSPFETSWNHSRICTTEEMKEAESNRANVDFRSTDAATSLGQGGYGRVDESSGASVYSIDFYVPPSRADGPLPTVALTYNSLSNRRAGLAGAGWRLELGCIERSSSAGDPVLEFTDNQGTKDCREQFDLSLNGESFTLVKVAGDQPVFAAKKEQSFIQATWVTNGELEPSGGAVITGWVVYTSSGLRYLFGHVPGENLGFDAQAAPVIKNKRWNLVKVEDAYGRYVRYDYDAYRHPDEPFFREVDYHYPTSIRAGFTRLSEHDAEVRFRYACPTESGTVEGELPHPEKGYGNLGVAYTGRDGLTAILWRRLVGIDSYALTAPDTMQKVRSLELTTELLDDYAVHRVTKVQELGYLENGDVDTGARVPAHHLEYQSVGNNPAILAMSTNPAGLVRTYQYGKATSNEVDQGDPQGMSADTYLVTRQSEQIEGEEPWCKRFVYADGLNYRTFDEYRGHREITVFDEATGHVKVSKFHQTGVFNRCLKQRQTFRYRTENRSKKVLIDQQDHEWVALDYGGGRYLPLKSKSTQIDYAEDGQQITRSVVSEIVKNASGTLEIDPIGFPLIRRETTFSGAPESSPVVEGLETRLTYEHRPGNPESRNRLERFRFFGLVQESQSYALLPDGSIGPMASHTIQSFNESGLIEQSFQKHTRAGQGIRTKVIFCDDTGRPVESFRREGEAWVLQSRTVYCSDVRSEKQFLAESVFNALGHRTDTLAYDMRCRRPTSVRDAGGHFTETTYDGLGRLATEGKHLEDGTHTQRQVHHYVQEDSERYTVTEDLMTGASRKVFWDSLGRQLKTIRSGFGSDEVIEEEVLRFDHATRRPAEIAAPRFFGEDSQWQSKTEYEDPHRLRPTRSKNAEGGEIHHDYQGLAITTTELILASGESDEQRESGRKRLVLQKTEDAAGRTISEKRGQHPEDGTKGERITHRYDALGRLVETSDHAGSWLQKIKYGDRMDAKPVEKEDRSLGKAVLKYDGLGRLIEHTKDHLGQLDLVTEQSYDALDRVVNTSQICVANEDASALRRRNTKYVFDSSPDGVGQLASVTVSDHGPRGSYQIVDTFSYDVSGQLRKKDRKVSAGNHSVDAQADLLLPSLSSVQLATDFVRDLTRGGRLKAVTSSIPDAKELSDTFHYAYHDVIGQVTSVSHAGKPVWMIAEKGLTAYDRLHGYELGNGVACQFTYDKVLGRLLSSEHTQEQKPCFSEWLRYDSSGNVISNQWKRWNEGRLESESLQYFRYDAQNRLVSVGDTPEQTATVGFTYDNEGRRLQMTGADGSTTYDYGDAQHPFQLTEVSGRMNRQLRYAPGGFLEEDVNVSSGDRRVLSWGLTEKPESIQVIRGADQVVEQAIVYGYDAKGTRAFSFRPSTNELTAYLGSETELQMEVGVPSSVTLSSHANLGRRIATSKKAINHPRRQLSYYVRDYLDSVRLLFDGTQLKVGSDYEAFGREHASRGSEKLSLSFTGHRRDFDECCGFSQQDFKARYYDPLLGVFLSPDPVDDRGNVSFGFHRYAYVGQNPVSRVDPTGLTGAYHIPPNQARKVNQNRRIKRERDKEKTVHPKFDQLKSSIVAAVESDEKAVQQITYQSVLSKMFASAEDGSESEDIAGPVHNATAFEQDWFGEKDSNGDFTEAGICYNIEEEVSRTLGGALKQGKLHEDVIGIIPANEDQGAAGIAVGSSNAHFANVIAIKHPTEGYTEIVMDWWVRKKTHRPITTKDPVDWLKAYGASKPQIDRYQESRAKRKKLYQGIESFTDKLGLDFSQKPHPMHGVSPSTSQPDELRD